jgi:hypothetical protein
MTTTHALLAVEMKIQDLDAEPRPTMTATNTQVTVATDTARVLEMKIEDLEVRTDSKRTATGTLLAVVTENQAHIIDIEGTNPIDMTAIQGETIAVRAPPAKLVVIPPATVVIDQILDQDQVQRTGQEDSRVHEKTKTLAMHHSQGPI